MRRATMGLALILIVGCQDKQAAVPDEKAAPKPSEAKSRPPAAVLQAREEPENDKAPARFDPNDARRTLRWLAALTEPLRVPNPIANDLPEQKKKVAAALTDCLKKQVKWKLVIASATSDGKLTFSTVRSTAFADRTELHPEITLTVQPWNLVSKDPTFVCPPQPWLTGVRPGQDRVTVQGTITAINIVSPFDWNVLLTDLQFIPELEASPAESTKKPSNDDFDPESAERTFAWIKHEICVALLPFGDAYDRKKRREDVLAKFRTFAGTKVRWSWPTTAVSSNIVAVQNVAGDDFAYQINVATGLLLKQPKISSRSGSTRVPGTQEYDKGYFGAPGSKGVSPEVVDKIRETKKATVSGKIAKIDFLYKPLDFPRALEIAVRLDDVSVEP